MNLLYINEIYGGPAMNILEVKGLSKSYPNFRLQDVCFSLGKGYIMGFIGRNGAGKTTTLKCIYNIVKRDGGEVLFDGKSIDSFEETALKEKMSLMLGGSDYFPNTPVKKVAEAVKIFYKDWDEEAFQGYLKRFDIDSNKKYKELSNGMKSKFYLAIAMSHKAKLLLLDEPTSGLDPFSREEILTLFQEYIADGEKSILFSTQIVSDLERVADYLLYIKEGKIIDQGELGALTDSYVIIKGSLDDLEKTDKTTLLGLRKSPYGFEAIKKKEEGFAEDNAFIYEKPDLERIMVMIEGGVAL